MLRLIAILITLAFAAPAAHADSEAVRNRIVSVLQQDGYTEIRISRTLLGRMRFVGSRIDARREIVVNPISGVVLRDYVRFLNASSGGSSGSSNGGGSQEADDDDYADDDEDYDDDEHDDEEDDDDGDSNSGRGGSNDDDDDESDNSGSGSSNSGSGSGSDDDDD